MTKAIFGSPKPAALPPPPPAPTVDNKQAELDAAADAERKARGRAATMLTGGQGDLSAGSGASRMLLA